MRICQYVLVKVPTEVQQLTKAMFAAFFAIHTQSFDYSYEPFAAGPKCSGCFGSHAYVFGSDGRTDC